MYPVYFNMSVERKPHRLQSQRSISQDDIATPWISGNLLKFRDTRLCSSDDGGAGYLEDDDTDSDEQEIKIIKKHRYRCQSKNRPVERLATDYAEVQKRLDKRKYRVGSSTLQNMSSYGSAHQLPNSSSPFQVTGGTSDKSCTSNSVTIRSNVEQHKNIIELYHQDVQPPRERCDSHDPQRGRRIDTPSHRVLCHTAQRLLGDTDWDIGDMRPRVASMPVRALCQRRPPHIATLKTPVNVHRVRSFIISHRGIVKEGELYISNSSMASTESNLSTGTSNHSGCSGGKVSYHRVIFSGGNRVGKRAIIQRFLLPDGSSTDNSSLGTSLGAA